MKLGAQDLHVLKTFVIGDGAANEARMVVGLSSVEFDVLKKAIHL
jgi:hypothetical protein